MKIIDLLNKIANGEDVPKKIKYAGIIWEYDNTTKDYISDDMFLIYKMNSFALNKSIKILEEENKIPEKLSTWYSVEVNQSDEENVEYENYNFETMYEKINEICDYLKSKGE